MNIEYVYLILIGINTCMEEKLNPPLSHSKIESIRNNENETKKLTIERKPGKTKITFH